jgi:hypothetical protein
VAFEGKWESRTRFKLKLQKIKLGFALEARPARHVVQPAKARGVQGAAGGHKEREWGIRD